MTRRPMVDRDQVSEALAPAQEALGVFREVAAGALENAEGHGLKTRRKHQLLVAP